MIIKYFKRAIKYILAPLILIAILIFIYMYIYGNFHKIDNNAYRSAQLFFFNMPYYIEKYNIKSIINLRGGQGKWFYKYETKISKEYNITHYDYNLSPTKMLSLNDMNKLVNIIKKAPKPILIHCKAGADRTSLVTALYLYNKHKYKKAEEAFSIKYLHFPWFGSKTNMMDESFKLYKKNHSYENK